MSHPTALYAAERKPYQLFVASKLGFNVPRTLVTNSAPALREFADGRRIVAKAVSSGYVTSSDGNRAIFTHLVDERDMDDLGGLRLAPVIFQDFVAKRLDVRVTVVGSTVFAVEILSQTDPSSEVDWRATSAQDLPHRLHDLPSDLASLCVTLVERLGLSFGAVDLAVDAAGDYVFFEVNPNGEWVWLEDRLGIPIADTIAAWLAGVAP